MQTPTAQAAAQAVADAYFKMHDYSPTWWTDLAPAYEWDAIEEALHPPLSKVKVLFYRLLEVLQKTHPESRVALLALESAALDWVTADGDVRFLLGIATGKQLAQTETKTLPGVEEERPCRSIVEDQEASTENAACTPSPLRERQAGGGTGTAGRKRKQRGM